MNRLFAALVAAFLALSATGCVTLQKTLGVGSFTSVDQRFQELDRLAKSLPENVPLNSLAVDLNITQVQSPVIGEDGKPLLGPNGNVVYAVTTTTERGLPSAPLRVTADVSDTFIEKNMGLTLSHTGDGSLARLDQVSKINAEAYDSGVTQQTAQKANEWSGINTFGGQLVQAAQGYFGLQQRKAELDFQAVQTKTQSDAALEMFRAGVIPQGFQFSPELAALLNAQQEAEHGGE